MIQMLDWLLHGDQVLHCMMTENGKYPLVYIPGFLCNERQHNNKERRPKTSEHLFT